MQVADALTDLLECAQISLDPPVCRVFKYPGDGAPHDVCSTTPDGADGQLWVGHVNDVPGWPGGTGEPTTCATPFAATIEIGIVRCAKGKLKDNGKLPPAEDVTADAEQQDADRLAIRNAILCCLDIDSKDLIIEGWTPITPQGGCVGGVWTITIRDSGCDCGSWDQS